MRLLGISLLIVVTSILLGCAKSNSPPVAATQEAPQRSSPPPESSITSPGPREAQSAKPSEPDLSASQNPQLASIDDAFLQIEHNYVDAVDDQRLVGGCRAGMLRVATATSIPEQSIAVGGSTKALQQINADFAAIQEETSDTVEDEKLVDACIDGMVRTLDDRSAFLDGQAFKELQTGSPAGIGIELEMEPGRLFVVAPIENGPAWRAGLKPGDAIVEIDDAPIGPPPLSQAMKPLRGAAGSKVRLTVMRPGAEQLLSFVLTRDLIFLESVKWTLLPDGIAYIRITQLQERTGEKLAKAMDALYAESQGDISGLVLDLRNNPGGLLNASVAVSAAFLPLNSLVVTTNGNSEEAKMRLYASKEYYIRGNKEDYFKKLPSALRKLPMVVLVNHSTASGSEIIAAALQDHKRATIMGERTFGVETIQTILPLKGQRALKLTTARYFRPSGNAIGPSGITPDVVLEGGAGQLKLSYNTLPGDDATVARAVEVLREKAPAKPK